MQRRRGGLDFIEQDELVGGPGAVEELMTQRVSPMPLGLPEQGGQPDAAGHQQITASRLWRGKPMTERPEGEDARARRRVLEEGAAPPLRLDEDLRDAVPHSEQ